MERATTLFPNVGLSFEVSNDVQWLLAEFLSESGKDTATEPWFVESKERRVDLRTVFPGGPSLTPLIVFALRHDMDEVACIMVVNGEIAGVVTAHTWTSSGYTVTNTYDDIWGWLHSMIDDIRTWRELLERNPDDKKWGRKRDREENGTALD